jgi:hypothetical protein
MRTEILGSPLTYTKGRKEKKPLRITEDDET